MARIELVTVLDTAAQYYSPPTAFRSAGAAVRWFEDQIASGDKSNPLCLHPEHFQLFHLGHFDDSTSEFMLLDRPVALVFGSAPSGS